MTDEPNREMQVGYTLSSEEHSASDLVRNAVEAERLGFDFLSISDHFHPWVDAQGQSPFVWATLGGIASATDRIDVGVGVCCPIRRLHPAIVAHAAATVATMLPNRFFLGVGTGELLNEHVLGQRWPRVEIRREMLVEAIDVIRRLWAGGVVDYDGRWFDVENARLYSVPETPPPIVMSAFGDESARAAAELGCGLWTTAPDAGIIKSYREAGGDGDIVGQLTFCWDRDESSALDVVQRWWPTAGLSGQLSQELPTPALFEQACATVDRDDLAGEVICGPQVTRLAEAVAEYRDAGFTRLHLHQIGPRQDLFFDAWRGPLGAAVRAA